jgi:hypothetical protein
MRRGTLIHSLILGLAACGGKDDAQGTATGADEGGSTSAAETTGPGTFTTNATSATTGIDTGGTDESGVAETGADTGASAGFIMRPDGGANTECDLWAQDCPEGQKCMPWANDGGNSWNATKCSPLDPNPNQPGDPCTVEGSGVSGIDDCDVGAMCWDVDPETNMGTCVGFCTGSAADPVCPDPATGCSVSNEGVLILCLPYCDPLLQDCPEGNACYPEENGFFCSPDASGPDLGGYGDPCEYLNVCDPGLWCAVPEAVPGCQGAAGCCSEFCDISDPAGDDQCMGAAMGQQCTPYYEEGAAPPGYENVGVCTLPL